MKLTGGQIVIKCLENEGIPYVLGIPGHGILGLFDALRESAESGNIRYLQVKHEQAAAHIADAYFRLTGKPLAIFTSIGPGTLNTNIGLATAYVDSSAFLLLAGDTHVHMKGVGVLQEIERYQDSNIIRALEPLTKRCWRAENVKQLPKIMQRAFNQMLTGRSGPVAVALPMDVQASAEDVTLPGSEGHKVKTGPAASEEMIEQAIELMETAKRPVILAGGAMLRSREFEKLQDLAERWGAAVVTTLAGKSAFPEDHPLNGFHTGSKGTPVGLALTRSADVILALGTRFADETTCSYRNGVAFTNGVKIIHVDIDSGEIGKNYPCKVGIIGDVSHVLTQLLEHFRCDRKGDNGYLTAEYTQEILKLKEDWSRIIAGKRSVKHEKITISQLIGVMQETLPDDTIIVSSSGNTQAQLFQEYCYKKPGTNLTTGGFSTMGWTIPASIGAKLARPDDMVFAFLGDGDFLMVMQEMATIAQYKIPVKIILADNCGWMAIKDLQQDVLGEGHLFGTEWMQENESIYTPDYAEISKNFGIPSVRVSTEEAAQNAIRWAMEEEGPAFIVVDVHREYPDSGGEAYGWWDVPIPANMPEKRAEYEKSIEEELL